IFSYVDDNFSWELDNESRMVYYQKYRKRLPEKQARLLKIWDCLGIPHARGKQEFNPVLTIIGYQVNLRRMRVTVSDERLERIVKTLFEFSNGLMVTTSLHDCRKLAGLVNWALEVNPLLRPALTALHREMAKADQSDGDAQVTITKRVASDLHWLAKLFRRSKGIHLTRMCFWD
ncbi:uncharacterized protein FOMMEDRAFT_62001, partial [Fomitiporia mediterranea MF3/22]|uniref:uncharacterized protein n=1 Tax=Fomitiporia mediterranea (strain MF3/22) TaxID=694068 RepID=UPI00044092A7